MASREAQGWQISVIIFAILTVILSITTYIFYSQQMNAEKDRDAAQTARTQAETQSRQLLYKLRACQFTLGVGGITEAEVEAAKVSAGQDDPEVNKLLADFKADMANFGDQAAPDGPRNYRTLPQFLLAAIRDRNVIVADTSAREKVLIKEKDDIAARESDRTRTAEDGQKKAGDDLTAERTAFNTAREEVVQKNTALAGQLAAKDKTLKDREDKLNKEIQSLTGINVTLQTTNEAFKGKLKEITKDQDSFESPDGQVTWVNQKARLVWINLGLADGLSRQANFSVYDHDAAGVQSAKPKGRIEVLRIAESHLAECRILEDSVSNPILPGDLIHTPAWTPGQKVRFALVGEMDIDGDGQSDREMIRNIITMNGGVVDAELKDDGSRVGAISVNTRYLIQGDKPTDKTNQKILAEYNNMLSEVQRFGVEVISVQKLLGMMGWKAEEKTVELSKSKDLTGFRTRTPGGAAPAAAAPVAPAPAPAAAPMPRAPVADPFAP